MGEPPRSDEPARYEDVERFFRYGTTGPGAGLGFEEIGAAFGLIEEEFGRYLDESLSPRGPESLYDLVRDADPPERRVAVDVGCGNGRDAVQLAGRCGLHVHGIDPRPHSIEAARLRGNAEGLSGMLDFHVGSAEAIPLPDESVDVLWCKEVLTFTDLDPAMREFHRVMRPTAVGVIYQVITGPAMSDDEASWFNSHEQGFGSSTSLRPADVEAALAEAGLVVRKRVDYASE